MANRVCAVYILTNERRTILYTGVTSDLQARLWEHQNKVDPKSFTARYRMTRLVHVEFTPNIQAAIAREKQLKNWRRAWKIELIEKTNPSWRDLSPDFGLKP